MLGDWDPYEHLQNLTENLKQAAANIQALAQANRQQQQLNQQIIDQLNKQTQAINQLDLAYNELHDRVRLLEVTRQHEKNETN
jgi:septal ring factor EnvC (AmiA/AmiB activator)